MMQPIKKAVEGKVKREKGQRFKTKASQSLRQAQKMLIYMIE